MEDGGLQQHFHVDSGLELHMRRPVLGDLKLLPAVTVAFLGTGAVLDQVLNGGVGQAEEVSS